TARMLLRWLFVDAPLVHPCSFDSRRSYKGAPRSVQRVRLGQWIQRGRFSDTAISERDDVTYQ
ncbi:hypothetical protein, partial [Arcticibacter eurypsychrophilus]|uniref:hypothetical protein n=1 Tax=Arcticibacter eurypsychrophilus TaxID=1434752 RepID=UPI001B8ACE3A